MTHTASDHSRPDHSRPDHTASDNGTRRRPYSPHPALGSALLPADPTARVPVDPDDTENGRDPTTTLLPAPDVFDPVRPPERVGAGHRVRWRRGTARRLTPRRVVGLARYGVGTGLDPDLTRLDEVVRARAARNGQRVLDRAARRNARRARRADALQARATALRTRATRTDQVVADPVRGAVPFAELVELHRRGAERIDADLGRADRRHRRPGRGHRRLAALLPWLDAALFAYFVSGVSNADLAAPWTTPVASLVALALTLLVVLVCAGFTPWLGRRLRADKDARGELDWTGLGPLALTLLGLWLVLVAALGTTMFVRVWQEAGYAGADTPTAVTVAGLLALCAVAMCGYVFGVAFADGTEETDDLDRRSRTIGARDGLRERLLRRAARLERRRGRVVRAAGATHRRALVRAAGRQRRGAELVDLARLRTGAPARREVLDPPLDLRELGATSRYVS